jgi:hypothetical protein
MNLSAHTMPTPRDTQVAMWEPRSAELDLGTVD